MRGEMTHPDTDVLAEFRAGLITGRRSARIAAHLAGCDRCAVLGDKLAAVTALLAAVPAPVMPKSVAQRLEVALAEEVAKKADPERSGSGSPRAHGAYEQSARNRVFRLVALRVLAPAAAAVLLAAGGYGLSHIGGQSNSAPSLSRSAPEAARGAANPKIKTRFSPAHRSYPSCTRPGSGAYRVLCTPRFV
jgi:anti-sigma factor RsiW